MPGVVRPLQLPPPEGVVRRLLLQSALPRNAFRRPGRPQGARPRADGGRLVIDPTLVREIEERIAQMEEVARAALALGDLEREDESDDEIYLLCLERLAFIEMSN